jgi:hypothetical protein
MVHDFNKQLCKIAQSPSHQASSKPKKGKKKNKDLEKLNEMVPISQLNEEGHFGQNDRVLKILGSDRIENECKIIWVIFGVLYEKWEIVLAVYVWFF